MKLYATERSHFARKVRLLLDHLEADYEMVDVGVVTNLTPEHFRKNPLMTIPVLEDEDVWLVESDHINRYIARKLDPSDRFRTLSEAPDHLNMRAVLNGIMSNEVKIVMSSRLEPVPDASGYLDKAKASILTSLGWIDDRQHVFDAETPGDLEFHFVAMWDHLEKFGAIEMPNLSLASLANTLMAQPTIAKSACLPRVG